MKMKSDLSRKILLIDESWSLLSRTEDASYIFEIVKTCRKFNLGLLLINQEVEGLLDSPAGKSILANSAYCMLMRQKPAVINNICKTFHLSEMEKSHLLTANIGEGLLIMEDDHMKIKVIASPQEHELITTNADEILAQKTEQINIKGENISIKLDPDKGYFKYNDLKKEEIEYLLRKKYIVSKHKSIFSNRKEKYMLKPRFNESPTHFFYVKEIAEYLKKYTDKIQEFTTKKPDIVFEINGKKIAIEVETGKIITHGKKRILEKIELLKKDYDKWFFFVTNKRFTPKYRKLGQVMDTRYFKTQIKKLVKTTKNSH